VTDQDASVANESRHPKLEIYEVFSQADHQSPFQHQFSLAAPNAGLALTLARENFLRRAEAVRLWVVPRSAVSVLDLTGMKRTDKPYRESEGYAYLADKWRKYRQAPIDPIA
jgi:ring-1,2-phenylacetyl-CoA epoxidase subunit PaaB